MKVARLRLRGLDFAVLAAAKIGALHHKKVAVKYYHGRPYPIHGWFMGDLRVDSHLARLVKAGELLQHNQVGGIKLLFPDDPNFKVLQAIRKMAGARSI